MKELSALMEFGHVVVSNGVGVTDYSIPSDIDYSAPEVIYQMLDDDGQCIDDELHDVPDGWEALTGFTGQYSYSGPVMHPSEYVGGRLERHIRETPGYYVAVAVDGMPPTEPDENPSIGWAVLYREIDQ